MRGAAEARRDAAARTAHRILLEVEALRPEGVECLAELARALTDRAIPTPGGRAGWTHTTVARLLGRAGA